VGSGHVKSKHGKGSERGDGTSIAMPSRFATRNTHPGVKGFTVAEQIFICGNGGLFCDNYITGGGTLITQDSFRDVLRVDTMTLTGFAPGQPFSITKSPTSRRIGGLFPSGRRETLVRQS
jgi:hypothetical protein